MGLACRVLHTKIVRYIYCKYLSENDASWNNLALKLRNHACSSKMDTCFFSAWIGFPIACEGDVDGTLGCLIGKLLGCGVVYLSDWLEHDHSTLTLWHGGMAPTQVSEEPLFFMLGGIQQLCFHPILTSYTPRREWTIMDILNNTNQAWTLYWPPTWLFLLA